MEALVTEKPERGTGQHPTKPEEIFASFALLSTAFAEGCRRESRSYGLNNSIRT